MDHMKAGKENGTYTTKEGAVYLYDIAWEETKRGCRWAAIVKRNGHIVATPGGEILNPNYREPARVAEAQLRYIIEGDSDSNGRA